MAAKYDFYKTPFSKDSMKRPLFHARIVSSCSIDTDDLAKRIHGRCTVTPADVAAVLISLSEVTAEYLREGKRVHIDGLGYLQVTLQCKAVHSTHALRAESNRFNSVAFRQHEYLTRVAFQRLCGLSSSTASRRLHQFGEAGKLRDIGTRHQSLYVAAR